MTFFDYNSFCFWVTKISDCIITLTARYAKTLTSQRYITSPFLSTICQHLRATEKLRILHNPTFCRLQNSRFWKFSEGAKRRKRHPRVWSARVSPHSPSPFLNSLQTFRSNMDAPSLVFAKNTTVLQSRRFAIGQQNPELWPRSWKLNGNIFFELFLSDLDEKMIPAG